MRRNKQYNDTVSSRIIKIASVAVSIGIAAILIAMAFSKGLQNEIRNKTSVFNGQVLIAPFENNESQVSLTPFLDTEQLRQQIKKHPNFERMHSVATKAGMFKTQEEFEGVLLKGVENTFDWSRLEEFLTQGNFPKFGEAVSNEVFISETVANRLSLKVGDTVDAFFQSPQGD